VDNPETLEVFLQYLSPSNPHFPRFQAIQKRIVSSRDGSQHYFLKYLPFRFHTISAADQQQDCAAKTLLNVLLLPDFLSWQESSALIRMASAGINPQALLETKISGTIIGKLRRVLTYSSEVEFEGTVQEILKVRHDMSNPRY
jgi:hypothetical protein